MAKGNRGGRRGGITGGLKPDDILSTSNLLLDTKLDEKTRNEVVKTLKDFQDEYGLSYNNTRIAKLKAKSNALAYYDGAGVAINSEYLNSKKMNDAYQRCVESGFHPKSGSKTGMEAVVAHELGHALTDAVGAKMGIKGGIDASSKRIVTEALKQTNYASVKQLMSKISGYAKHSHAETIAEAIADVYCNGNRANAGSKAIVNTINKYLKPKGVKSSVTKATKTVKKLTKGSIATMKRSTLEKHAIDVFVKQNASLGKAEATRRAKALMSGNSDAQLRKYVYKYQ